MEMNRILTIFLFVIVACGDSVTKTKVDSPNESSIPKEVNIVLSSNDNMLFDKQILYASSRQKINLL